MDPVTHAVIGMAVSKATGNGISLTDPVSMCIIAGAMFPDIDIVLQKWGDYVYLKNHRGLTHSIFGLAVSSVLIAIVMGKIFHYPDVFALFWWSLLGCASHTAFDILNSYGAKLLWPLTNKKFSMGLLTTFDPVFFGSLVGFTAGTGMLQKVSLTIFLVYLAARMLLRFRAKRDLRTEFAEDFDRIYLLPSMIGVFRWHFVLEKPDCNIIGEKKLFNPAVNIIKVMDRNQDSDVDRAMLSPLGQFFREFTPVFHVGCEKNGDVTKYIFTDMRYCVKDRFLHHGLLELDEDDNIVSSFFCPYSINRKVEV